jgi:hypothetical protein
MSIFVVILTTVLLSVGTLVQISAGQPAISPRTIRCDLLMIKGDTYIVREISGVLRHLRVDMNTKKDRLIVPGEKIEVQVSPDGRALSIKPVP